MFYYYLSKYSGLFHFHVTWQNIYWIRRSESQCLYHSLAFSFKKYLLRTSSANEYLTLQKAHNLSKWHLIIRFSCRILMFCGPLLYRPCKISIYLAQSVIILNFGQLFSLNIRNKLSLKNHPTISSRDIMANLANSK